jgi:hypothetical protein
MRLQKKFRQREVVRRLIRRIHVSGETCVLARIGAKLFNPKQQMGVDQVDTRSIAKEKSIARDC